MLWKTELSRTEERPAIDVLMYHSIGAEPGPTSIRAEVFREQMSALKSAGYASVSLTALPSWVRDPRSVPRRAVVITFDDGFQDFADVAFPILQAHGFSATVFLPTGRLGGREDWYGKNQRPRPLMSWSTVQQLSREGIEFGGHTVTHADLTTLNPQQLTHEISRSQTEIAEHLGFPTLTFAPPYGRTNARVRAELARHARVSVGTALGRMETSSDLNDCPRLEMFYFQTPALWRSYLQGRADWYLAARRAARQLRTLALARRWRPPSSPNP